MKPLRLFLLLPLLTILVASSEDRAVDVKGVGACVEFSTKHFMIRSNVGAEERKKAGEAAETAYQYFINLLSPYRKIEERAAPFGIYYFNTGQELANYCKENKVTLYSPIGFYHPGTKICYLTKSPYGALSSLYHETIHQLEYNMLGFDKDFLMNRNKRCTWIVEGFANYVETALMGDDPQFQKKPAECLKKISQFMKLKEFCSLDYERMSKVDMGVSCGMYIVVFHYFIHGQNGKFKDRFLKHALLEGKASGEDLESILGLQLDSLQEDFIAHAKNVLQPKKK